MSARRPRPPRDAVHRSTSCEASPIRSAACCGVMCPVGHRRRRHAERRELVDQPLGRDAVGPLMHAVQRRHAPRLRNRATCSLAAIIRCSISRWDSVCATGSAAITLPRRSNSNSGSADSSASAACDAARAARAPPPRPARAAERRAPRLPARARGRRRCGRLARSRAARRSGSPSGRTRCCDDPGAVEHDLGVTASRSCPGTSEQARSRAPREASARPRRARRRWSRAGRPRGRAATRRARRRTRRRCGPKPAALPSSSLRARDRVVEVTRGGGVDGERRQLAQVAPAIRRRRRHDRTSSH